MTDTHTHIYMPEFDDGGAGAVVAALEAGVEMMVFPGVDSDSVDRMKELHSRFPGNTALSIGLHPTELEENWEEELESIDRAFDGCEVKAIGETGMDLYWDSSFEERQRAAFARHIDMAHERSLPVIIHCREALVPVLEVIAERKKAYSAEGSELPLLIFHSFTGNREDVVAIREVCDPYFGINGVVTFKNAAGIREALPEIGIERLLLETDSPYLSPVPFRGKRNESARIPIIRDKIAEVLGISAEEVEKATDSNASVVFDL